MTLKIATSQFPVSSSIISNKENIIGQMEIAATHGCDVIHFPEGSLSGYAGIDFPSFAGFDWAALKSATLDVMDAARRLGLWVVLGSSHPLTGEHKPHNSLYIISPQGVITDRYDKLFCAGDESGETGDLAHYSPGTHFTLFEIKGICCAVLICHDYRYPELYRELKQRNAEVIFHSYHAANMDHDRRKMMEAEVGEENFKWNTGHTYPEITMPATMVSYAANNYLWISCANSSAKESCWASFMVRPDGVITGRLEKNVAALLFSEIDPAKTYYDSTKYWRSRSINGFYHSGTRVEDARSLNRTEL
ncbi:carbon-nitrogen hydrolase family protein [Chitinophaga horti]|uniref:Carbon-nitrogen hydrolase family protein n=1 Tax=Chitinophaga horti TaxID=2920382 RepID=A0ABY6J0S6_9BACT|nr:carbon-nitrogen hydrolase family protein [Chitinophaga horti]UYQ91742.1 carbon-nitrogen hydrolase family protein [Chitinophaga horti]